MPDTVAPAAPPDRLEQAGLLALFGVAGALQFSIAAAQIFLGIAAVLWVVMLATRRVRFEAPWFFWPLVAYAAITLVSAAFSSDPAASVVDSRQLALFLLVPITYTFAAGSRSLTLMTVIVSFAAISAAFGIFQYGILHYDNLGRRPQGTLGHYMTYSGLLMLVICVALARVLFGRGERTWAALVMPALAVAVALSFGRSAMVGACVAAALLLTLKDFRLLALLPIVAAVSFAIAPGSITARYMSMFDVKDPTRIDRVAMLQAGRRMIAANPVLGVGPNMVGRVYPEYRNPDAKLNPHLHNVPVQIAAERGLPALFIWLWFVATVVIDTFRRFYTGEHRFQAAAGLAAVAAMLAAGMFEYNFGDSEFLMLFLIVITAPFAAEHPTAGTA
ncbi:MAG: O-antigen ligase family protein [Acidobacteria bacterium]|nr:O-antigen ligase family protein [Acidobacteriota bacterium]